jgi:hypothetical protein
MNAADTPKPRAPRWRRWTAGFLIVLSCILAPLSVVSIWVRNQLLNTDRYVETVKPLASNPAIIDTAATQITNTLFDNVNVQQAAEDALPPRADFLAAPLAAGLEQVVQRAAVKILSSDQFQTVWVEANRRAHNQLDKALTGEGTLQTQNGKVVLDLSAIVESVRLQLKERGIGIFDRIPIDDLAIQLNVIDAKQIDNARSATKLLNQLSWALPILSLVCLGGGLALSSNRRRSLTRWGIGTAVAVALVGAGVAIGRSIYLDAVTSPTLPQDTAAAVFDTLVRFLRYGVRLVIAVALVVALAAWLTGPTRAATGVRSTAKRIVGGAGESAGSHGMTFGAFGAWVAHYRAGLRIAAVLLALVTLLLWNQPRGGTVLALAILLLIALALIEFVARAGGASVSREEVPAGSA